MSGAPVTAMRHDETLYSGMARLSRYLGGKSRGALQKAVLSADLSLFDDMPVGIGRIAASGAFGRMAVDDAVREWTLLQYHGHFAGPEAVGGAIAVMQGDGGWPHQVLGSWFVDLPPPDRLRFCPACMIEMLDRHPDPWWRRTHQLPSSLVCPDHGIELRPSTVTRDMRRRGYVAASRDVCPDDMPPSTHMREGHVEHDLLVLAREGDALLNDRGGEDPALRLADRMSALEALGMTDRRGHANLPRIAQAMDRYWGPTLDVWPGLRLDGRCGLGWLVPLFTFGGRAPPLHHLLLERLLSALTRA
ncbi:TniQ protein [Sphingomonas palmae]|uniref:TniQ protein n=1 Tax=Sphingomonas palmae TaxID=1855283 RepID=A0A1H7U116_9SPHN|nr:TniQ family protein [Sphingomonas palmae]SEL90750.1 TniQ protein [Sphingomonas palmae]